MGLECQPVFDTQPHGVIKKNERGDKQHTMCGSRPPSESVTRGADTTYDLVP